MSEAPTRHITESNKGNLALWHGTKLPIWFNKAISATERMYVLLPPMLGPVMMWRREESHPCRDHSPRSSSPNL